MPSNPYSQFEQGTFSVHLSTRVMQSFSQLAGSVFFNEFGSSPANSTLSDHVSCVVRKSLSWVKHYVLGGTVWPESLSPGNCTALWGLLFKLSMTVDTLYNFHSIRSSDFCIVASKVAVVVFLSDITNDREENLLRTVQQQQPGIVS